MTILAFLQNQWFKDPETVKRMVAEHPERRRRYIAAFLFMGCATGRRLKQVFGNNSELDIVWEEASPEIGSHSRSQFAADRQHMQAAIREIQPDVILCFGNIARNGLQSLPEMLTDPPQYRVIYGPHPTARGDDTMARLKGMRKELDELLLAKP